MTILWTAAEAAAATGGRATTDWAATGVSIDTRSLAAGDIFVALTDQRDGHDFVAQALEKGAAAALVSRVPEGVASDAPLLIVEDVLPALEALGRAARARSRAKVIGVTGSVGKTGTKEMLRAMLEVQGHVHAAERSFNNHWGVPLTLARLPKDADFAVIEIGMNAPGEISPLSQMARPHAAIITTVAAVHIENFENIQGIAREKAAILDGLEPGGAAILNRDIETYPILNRRARRLGARIVSFGAAGRPTYRLRDAQMTEDSTQVEAMIARQPLLFKIAAPGLHLALNALSALAAVEAVGGDVAQAALALGQWHAPDGRGARWTLSLGSQGVDGTVLLIDDAFNANPTSMEAALGVLAAIAPKNGVGRVQKGRRIAFLTDMLELGSEAEAAHEGIADLPVLKGVDRIHCAGPLMQALHNSLPHDKRGEWHPSAEKLASRAGRLLDAGDVVLVKGSKGSKASRIVDAMLKLGQATRADIPRAFEDGEG
ncbi:UDP-N-acetylmuramoyl-tripeptide--D-alanyl-D-alanine ligase [Rubricella aquisinus]|uniref:UDP-N-acetylmuramoyl-tripeptide--D-alanyl-D-alanine ligase n=1 Tax=Rubricella aquisinus TaxID=2028108 RepID=A0A840WJV1_9RHOB|nr:UDP-N-acetylmuramoyl-tripeptide--D-alanyl-D-alanine ligase [Rubricella aquisinus]MBB5515349.1 UDP-N-acetylmuramoyl-tripeptide--D-alanyl-D-alanine ligase [Rubricella aquisinus]